MLRIVLTELVLFLSPFAVYAVWLWLERRAGRPGERARVSRYVGLALGGAILALSGLVTMILLEQRETGTYRPAEFRDGQVVPGRIE